MKVQENYYEEPVFEMLDFEICNIISDSIDPADAGEGGVLDPPD